VRRLARLPGTAGVAGVYVYRYTLGAFAQGRCKYHPSCSQYAIDAFRELGLLRGSLLAAWRLVRCNPWSHGGVDHVRDRRLFAPSRSRRTA
jgi:putative membrane protein insertion efficiency factor